MFKRLRNLWNLSQFQPKQIQVVKADDAPGVITVLDEVGTIDLKKLRSLMPVEGDGKAEFLPDMDDATLLEWQRNEDLGWKNFKLPGRK